MGYSSYLKPRPEVITGEGVEGIIDLANLRAETSQKIESNPQLFFDLTYPTSDIKNVLEHIHNRFFSKKASSGLFLFEGLKGSGKSHLLLFIYNLFKHYDIAEGWLKRNGIQCDIPKDVLVVINKFTDNPYESIWEYIFNALGKEFKKGKTHPKLTEFEKALGDKQIILIFDELEQGIKVISDPALQAQNIAFLQMLSEFSNRLKQVTMFASIYSDKEEPGATLKRVPRLTVQFDNSKDRCNVILHRLFENYQTFNRGAISPVIESYVQIWKKHATLEADDIKNKFQETYPFTPSLMEIVLKRIPSRGGFQNVRGALSFLGNLVKLTHAAKDIITPADASLEDKANVIMLKDLDVGGDLISRATENMMELKSKVPISNQLASSVLLYTITGFKTDKGVYLEALIPDILSPSVDINVLQVALQNFQKYGSYFHTDGTRYFFDLEEQPEAKVEIKSLHYPDDQAREYIEDIMKTEVFREPTVVFTSVEQTHQLLQQYEKNRLRYVLAGRRLAQEERHQIYYGMEYRNQIILLEPKDNQFQLLADKDLLKWAKRVKSAKALAEESLKTTRKSDYERIARTEQSFIIERIKKAGLMFVHWSRYGATVNDDNIDLEPISGDCSKDKVLNTLSQDLFPLQAIKEHLESRSEEIIGKTVKEIDSDYKMTLGFPVPTHATSVSNAIRALCKENLIGIQHTRDNACGRNPNLSEAEILGAIITPPFEEQETRRPIPGTSVSKPEIPISPEIPRVICSSCGQEPCVCPKKETVPLRVPPQTSIGGLRQEVAYKLQQLAGGELITVKATFKVFFQKDSIGDLSTLPGLLRGNLSGQGDIMAEISITKSGRFTKSQIEQQIEALPSIPGADYSLELLLEISQARG